MDPGRVAELNLVQILPEFEEGGVERHVLWLGNALAGRGHRVTVISAGGKLEAALDNVRHWKLPVHKKNPLTGFYCAVLIAKRARKEGWQVLHSHSRVPSWIAWWASTLSGIPWMVTCHANYSRNQGLIPYRHASTAICVSSTVRENLKGILPPVSRVIPNGLPDPPFEWHGPTRQDPITRFLFIGRLSRIKGIQDLVEVFSKIQGEWSLDVLGDGPLMSFLRKRTGELGLEKRIVLHGFRDDTDQWLRNCSCLIFPSYQEGMPLTLARAIQMKVPVIASNISPVREMTGSEVGLLAPGDHKAWQQRIEEFMEYGLKTYRFNVSRIPTLDDMTDQVEKIYSSVISGDLS